jgi:pilus assembly protein CpaB
MKNKLILVLALCFGLVAAFATFKYLETAKETYRLSGNYAEVAVAVKNLPTRTVINQQMLNFKEVPTEFIHPDAVLDVNDAVGKIVKSEILAGEQLLYGKLVSKEEPDSGLSAKVETGKRAITVPINNVIALHGLVRIGDNVDILVTFEDPREKKADTGSVRVVSTLIQNVPIIAINNMLEDPKDLKDGFETLTVMVEPAQAQQIALALDQGNIHMVLRTPDDEEIKSTPINKMEHLLR